jgi:hypothetical protein
VAKADRLRDDLLQSRIGNGRHAFEVAIDDDPHFSTVRVRIRGTDYFLHNALEKAARRNGERFNNSMLDGVPTCRGVSASASRAPPTNAFAPRSSPRRAGLLWEAAQAFGTAVEHNSPILTSVSPAYSTAWAAFSAPLGVVLSCDDVGLDAWWTQLSLSRSR